MKTLTAEVVHDAGAQLGEGPLWDYRSGELVWLDTPAGLVRWHRPADGANREIKVPAPVSTICLREPGGYVLTHGRRLGVLAPGADEGADVTEPVGLSHILNDGSGDARGRLWVGTAPRRALPPAGRGAWGGAPPRAPRLPRARARPRRRRPGRGRAVPGRPRPSPRPGARRRGDRERHRLERRRAHHVHGGEGPDRGIGLRRRRGHVHRARRRA